MSLPSAVRNILRRSTAEQAIYLARRPDESVSTVIGRWGKRP
jgi:hypothetical protein